MDHDLDLAVGEAGDTLSGVDEQRQLRAGVLDVRRRRRRVIVARDGLRLLERP